MDTIPVMQSVFQDRLLVAAIDFGTTFSGYAFSFKYEFQSDPLKISGNQWPSGAHSYLSLKAPSCILFDQDRNFHSFGFEAEDHYTELVMDGKHHDWYFYKHFKMLLYDKKGLKRDMAIPDDKGLQMPAIEVFSAAIRYLKDRMLSAAKERDYGLGDQEIHWVLTVPAIWDDPAKQFMREAAIRAGIKSEQLTLALEPEAAAMYCKYLPVERVSVGGGSAITCFRPGSKYLVLDAGGGTVDITVHEVQSDQTMRELFKANGGPWGGTTIEAEYEKFIAETFGQESLDRFKGTFKEDYLEFMREFEIKKRSIGPDMDQRVTFKIPTSLNECCHDVLGMDFRASVHAKGKLQGQVSFAGDKLRVDADLVKGFFGVTCDKIVNHLSNVLKEKTVIDTRTILMVGGFSESMMLRGAIMKAFSNLRVIVPNEAGLAVLKGAVIFGHNPTAITTRVCRFTYGIETNRNFKEGKDDYAKRFVVNGTYKCRDVFSRHIQIGRAIDINEELEGKTYYPLYPDQKEVAFKVFTSTREKPKYTDEDGCNYLGVLTLTFQDQHVGCDRPVEVRMKYGGTELTVTAVEVNTGQTVPASFDFLG